MSTASKAEPHREERVAAIAHLVGVLGLRGRCARPPWHARRPAASSLSALSMRALASATLICIGWVGVDRLAGRGGVALARRADHQLVGALGAAQHDARQHVGPERQQRQAATAARDSPPSRHAACRSSPRPRSVRYSGTKSLGGRTSFEPGAGEAHCMPSVDDLVLRAMERAKR